MLFGEWKLEDALVVEREEGREEIARNALREGASVEFIQKITGLSTETIQSLTE
jgi:predicted transposase YdaD